MIVFVGCRVECLELFLLNRVHLVAVVAEVEVEAVVALVPHVLDRHLSAPVALHHLLHRLPGLHYDLDAVLFRGVAPDLECLERSGEVAVLAEAEMGAVCAHKAGAYDWLHVAADTLVLVVRC